MHNQGATRRTEACVLDLPKNPRHLRLALQRRRYQSNRPNATLQSARGQTPSQRSPAFELPDFSKVKIGEGHSNHRMLHIYTAGESIDYLVSRFEAYGTLEYLLVHDEYATVS